MLVPLDQDIEKSTQMLVPLHQEEREGGWGVARRRKWRKKKEGKEARSGREAGGKGEIFQRLEAMFPKCMEIVSQSDITESTSARNL